MINLKQIFVQISFPIPRLEQCELNILDDKQKNKTLKINATIII